MDSSSNSSSRRSEDIALDLLKFVAGHANLSRSTTPATGFGIPSSTKPEDAVTQIFELYARCREAVESPTSSTKK
jgi:hypothetical protein